jgi:predicted CopG family antitoxin
VKKLKTVSVDLEAFKLLRRAKLPRESYGDVVRRVFAEATADVDIEAHLDELFREYGGKGMMTPAARRRLRERQKTPPRSLRPLRRAV